MGTKVSTLRKQIPLYQSFQADHLRIRPKLYGDLDVLREIGLTCLCISKEDLMLYLLCVCGQSCDCAHAHVKDSVFAFGSHFRRSGSSVMDNMLDNQSRGHRIGSPLLWSLG